jgi:hypothetical protein
MKEKCSKPSLITVFGGTSKKSLKKSVKKYNSVLAAVSDKERIFSSTKM